MFIFVINFTDIEGFVISFVCIYKLENNLFSFVKYFSVLYLDLLFFLFLGRYFWLYFREIIVIYLEEEKLSF